MKNKNITLRQLTLASVLAAVSAVLQLYHLGYQSPTWGMWIDLVAVTWVAAFFLFGIRVSFLVSLLGALVITLFAPDTWLGASMKWAATIPILFAFFAYSKIVQVKLKDYEKIKNLIIPFIGGVIVRSLIVLPLNYFYAIPIWTGMTTTEAIKVIPWFIIVIFNFFQTVIDIFLAWILVFRFKLTRFALWNKN